ncbi:MAG: CarD family transcriptional regulator [bacterium]
MENINEVFEAGEKVIYPQFGLGTISGVTQKQVNGTSHSFYRLEFPLKQMEILVPVTRASENGLRRVMSSKEVEEVLKFLSSAPPPPKPQQWHRWRKKTLEQLKSGHPLEIAKIYCHLNILEGKKGLSFTERKILLQVERMLISEIAVAQEITEEKAESYLAKCSSNGKPKNGGGNGIGNGKGAGNAGSTANGGGNGRSNGG